MINANELTELSRQLEKLQAEYNFWEEAKEQPKACVLTVGSAHHKWTVEAAGVWGFARQAEMDRLLETILDYERRIREMTCDSAQRNEEGERE